MSRRPRGPTRRAFLRIAGGAALSVAVAARGRAAPGGGSAAMRTKPIPRTGEPLPVIGLGTWQTFDVGPGDAERAPLLEVLRRLFAAGGRVIDSSPMYGRSESVVGDLVRRLRPSAAPFLATKVWTEGREAGEEQMRESMRRMGTERMDLMQIHNLVDWETHLATLRAWKEAGRIRYVGITHYSLGAFEEMERILRREKVDFVQLPYSVGVRRAEARLLPAAADTGTAVLVMRPFEQGGLLRSLRGRPVPPWAAEIGCSTWSQLLLKFIVSHPAVTCAIPATANPDHLADNVRAGSGPVPDEATRRRIAEAVAA